MSLMSGDRGDDVDVALIGAGVMSATLGTLLRKLNPCLTMAIFERRPGCLSRRRNCVSAG